MHADYWIGAAAKEITPPREWIEQKRIYLWGYGSRSEPACGMHDAIWSRALAIRDQANTCIVLVAVDVCAWNAALTFAIQEHVNRAVGIPGKNILINVTHTHSAPVTLAIPTWNPGVDHPDADYLMFAQDQIVASIIEALDRQQPATLHLARGNTHVGISRHFEDGAHDETLDVVVALDAQENPIAIAFCHGCHPTALTDLDVISADFVGVARDLVEQAVGGCAIFFQGYAGTTKPAVKDIVVTGETLGKDVVTLAHSQMERLGGAIKTRSVRVNLPLQPLDPRALDRAREAGDPNLMRWADSMSRHDQSTVDALETWIQVVRVGLGSRAWYLAASAHEVVAELAKPIRAIAPSECLTLLGYTHSQMSYLPTQDVLANPACEFPSWQNYEGSMSFVWYGHRAPMTSDVESLFVASHAKLFDLLGEES